MMHRHNKVIRIFVSSTFEDMKDERNCLQQGAFRRLREYCRERSWQFQAVDLRWGISEEATIDQRTMEICLREIERCQQQSPRPNFIVLLGERYGWRPLPDTILKSVAEQMEPVMPENLVQLFDNWYELDENQLPEPVWKLQARHGRFWDYKTYDKDVQQPLVEFFAQWSAQHLPDPDQAGSRNDPRALQRLKMERSATEQEIQAGALRVKDAPEHVFAFLRSLPEAAESEPCYHDADQTAVTRLRDRLTSYLPASNLLTTKAGWNPNEKHPTPDHLKELDDKVYEFLKGVIDVEIDRYENLDQDTLENDAHLLFAKERIFGFSGREQDIESILNYVASDDKVPFLLWGASGTGKSALMAMAASRIMELQPQTLVLSRYIGVTSKASNGASLLQDICRFLRSSYGAEAIEVSDEPTSLEIKFRELLALATEEKPLVLFLDALDQLSEYDFFRELNWLPCPFPKNVKIVLSTLDVDYQQILRQRQKLQFILYELLPLEPEDGGNALEVWLKRAKRTLQKHQRDQIIKNFALAGCPPLYLHLAFDRARHWESYSPKQRLGRDITEMIENIYAELSIHEAHGPVVEKALTALRCAKQGLSDDEILGILASDDKFWSSFQAQNYHEMEEIDESGKSARRISPVYWTRLYHELEYYLSHRNVHGTDVITFYHRQLAEAVDGMYLPIPAIKQARHSFLADFFAKKSWFISEEVPLTANTRKCDELPWQLIKGGDWDAVVSTLCNLDFIQAKAVAKMTDELMEDFNTALNLIPENAYSVKNEQERLSRMERYPQGLIAFSKGEIKAEELCIPKCVILRTEEENDREIERQKTNPTRLDKLKAYYSFLGQEANNLQNYAADFPFFAFQQAWNWSADGQVGKEAENLTQEQRQRLLLCAGHTRPPDNPQPQMLQNLQGHQGGVYSVALSLDGTRAVSGSDDNTLKVWDLESGECLLTLEGHTGAVQSVALSPDCSRAVSGSNDDTLKVWDLKSGKCLQTLEGHTMMVCSVALSPDCSRAVSGSWDYTIKVWDLESGKCIQTLKEHKSFVNSVVLGPDGNRMVSGSLDNTIKVWDLKSGNCLLTLEGHTGSVRSVALSPDGGRVVSGSGDKTVKVWDLVSGKCLHTFEGHTGEVSSIAISPDGSRAVSGSWDNTLKVWDLESGKFVKNLKGHTFSVMSVALSPDGSRAVSGAADKTLKVWDLVSGKSLPTAEWHTSYITTIALSPDGRRAVSGSLYKTLKVWDLVSGKCLQTLVGHTDWILSVVLSPDGSRVVSASGDNTLKVWDMVSGKCLQTLEGHSSYVISIAISSDGSRVVSASGDKTLKVWDLVSGKCLQTIEWDTGHVTSITLSPDGKLALFVLDNRTLKAWDLVNGKCSQLHNGLAGSVSSVAFSPDGRRAILGLEDRTLTVWDLVNDKCLPTLKGHTGAVSSVAFSSDGSRAVSGSPDNTIKVWNLENGKCLAQVAVSGLITSLGIFHSGIVAGGTIGRLLIFNASRKLLCPDMGIVTVRSIWDFANNKSLPLSSDCPFCGHRFHPEQNVLDTIDRITSEAGITVEDSPCLSLPKEVWDDPGLLSNCPKCGGALKFNPFIPESGLKL